MAEYFRGEGVRVEAVHSQIEDNKVGREKLVEEFKERKISVLFAVDIFNEGVDIPEIDNVIDFIGNYKRAHYKPLLLAGKNPMLAERIPLDPDNLLYPEVSGDF